MTAELDLGGTYTVTSSGTVTVNGLSSTPTASLKITSGSFTVTNFAGQGPLILSGGTFNIGSSTASTASLTHTGSSTLTGTGTVTVTGTATFSGGTYVVESGSGTTDLQAGATGTLSGGILALDGGRKLQNDAVFNWTGGSISMGNNPLGTTVGGSTIVNSVGATFNDNVVSSISSNSGTNVFSNAGTFATNFSSGTTNIGVTFNNSGGVQVGAGSTLSLNGGGSSTGGSFSGAGTLQFTNGYTFDAASSIATTNVIFSGGTIALSGTYTAPHTTLSSGTLNTGSSPITLGTNFTQTGGTLSGTGTVTITGSASLGSTNAYALESGIGTTDLKGTSTLSGSNVGYYFALDGGRVLQNEGTFTWTGGPIDMGSNPFGTTVGGSTIVNSLGAIFNDAAAYSIVNGTGTNVFNNAGTFKTTFTSGTTTIGVAFNNTGSVQVGAGGTLNLSSGGTSGGSFTDGGTVQFSSGYTFGATSTISTANVIFSGGTTNLAGTYSATNTTLSGGTLTAGSSPITLGTNFTQTGGTLSGTGTVTITGSASLGSTNAYALESGIGTTDLKGTSTLSGSNVGYYFALDGGRVLQNDGTLTWTGGPIDMGSNPFGTAVGGSTIVNSLGAIFNDAVAYSIVNGTGTNVFNNAGTFETSFASGTTSIGVTFNNTGIVEVQTGTLDFSNAVTGTGAYTIGTASNGATLEFDSSVAAGATVTFEGPTGTLLILQPPSFSTSNVISGISGTGDVLDLRGFFSGSDTVHATTGAGSFNGTNTTLTVTDVTHSATFQFTLQGDYSGSTWTVTSDGHGGFNIIDPPATFATIASGGSLELDAPSNETVSFAGGTGSLVLNQPEGFTGQIVGFTGTAPDPTHSDTIDLIGIDYNSSHFAESYSASTGLLTVTDGDRSASFTFVDFNATLNFSSDGNGGTLITDPPAAESAAAAMSTSALSDGVSGSITFATTNSASAETASFTPDGSHYLGNFSLGSVTENNDAASLEFNFNSDQINLAQGQTLTQSYNVSVADPHNPAGTMNQTVSVSIGGSGSDNFVFKPGIGADTVVNFKTQHDTIELDNFSSAQTVQQLQTLINTDIHGDAVIELGHDDSITLAGTTAQQLQAIVHGSVYLH